MANFGRYVCVALPFLLTLASLIALLVGGLAGVAGDKENLYMFRVNLTDLQVKPTTISSLVGRDAFPQAAPLVSSATSGSSSNELSNITGADLGLNKIYDVNLWGFCYVPQTGSRTCLQGKFNWAETELNSTLSNIKTVANAAGVNVTLPTAVTEALNTFATVTRWTEIVFIIATISLGVALLLGIVANCSRAVSCLTWMVAGIASTAVCAFAALATATAVIVVGTVESVARFYGVSASFNTRFLAAVWVAAAFALAAGFFWLFTVCCCSPEHRSSRKDRSLDAEKSVPTGAYAPLSDNQGGYQNNSGYYHQNTAYGAPHYQQTTRPDMAYEPYSHTRT